jgi:predicted GNAT family acetyltransferase
MDLARRFEADISPLGAGCDESEDSLMQLAEILRTNGSVVVGQRAPVVCPPGSHAAFNAQGIQMIFDSTFPAQANSELAVRLTETDGPDMLALANLTRPGPFAARTYLLGDFWGIRHDGRLIAMAGERLKMPGYTELSAICTYPDHRGKGLGRQLCSIVLNQILGRGEIPFLHVYASNTTAIRLYEDIGFRERIRINVVQLEPGN